MPDALFTILTVFGWIAVIVGAVLLVWDGVTHRILSRPGLAAVVVGVVLLILAAVLPPATVHTDDYHGAAACPCSLTQ